MPRYYCDYCGTYLTHDSAPGRRQHNRGWKHTDNVKLHYKQFLDDFLKTQAANGASGSGSASTAQAARPVNPSPRNMGSAPSRPVSMGSGSLGMGAMSNSLMPGGMPGRDPMNGMGPMAGGPMMGTPMTRGPMGGPRGYGMGPPPGGFGMGGPRGGMGPPTNGRLGAPRGPPSGYGMTPPHNGGAGPRGIPGVPPQAPPQAPPPQAPASANGSAPSDGSRT